MTRSPAPTQRRRGRYGIVGLATFTKALPYNPLGEVDPGAYRALLRSTHPPRPARSPSRPDILDQVARSANAATKAAW